MKLSNWLQKNGIARAAFAREVGRDDLGGTVHDRDGLGVRALHCWFLSFDWVVPQWHP